MITVVTVASPWYPLALSHRTGPQCIEPVPFEQWIAWRANMRCAEQSSEYMLDVVRAALA
jgi:hypothetical protein